MSLLRNRVRVRGFTLCLSFLVSAAVGADQAVLPLGSLLGSPDAIVLGTVVDTRNGQLPGDFLLSVEVEETLKGNNLSQFVLQGNDRNSDSFPRLPKGTGILAFLQLNASKGFDPVGGEQGVVVVDDPSADVSREIVLRGLKLGDDVALPDFDDLFKAGTPVPPSLLDSLTQELSRKLTLKDQAFVGELACDPQGAFLPAVQLWAMGQVGPLAANDARPCLEDFLFDEKNGGRAIAAAEALGDLRDPGTVPALVKLLQSLPADQRLFGAAKRGDSNPVAGKEDPEEENDPRPDPGEDSDPGELELLPANPPQSDGDGDREPDGAASNDRPRFGGGLTEAAVLALGKIGDPAAIPFLVRIARLGDDFALHSTAVNAIAACDGSTKMGPLRALSRSHPNPLVRQQAREAYDRLRMGGVR